MTQYGFTHIHSLGTGVEVSGQEVENAVTRSLLNAMLVM